MKRKLHKLAAVAAVSAALCVANGVAHGAPESVVDVNKKGIIHLTKYDDTAGVSTADGTQKTDINATALQGIKFTLTPLQGVDFSTNEGLQKAAAFDAVSIAAGTLPEGITKGEATVSETNAEGKIDFDNLAVGAYLLEETDSVAADGKTYKAAAPSILFLPTTNPQNHTQWLTEGDKYALWVYPKNSLEENIKSVTDTGVQAGGDVTFSITASIPRAAQGEKLNDFGFWDTVDPALDINGKQGDITVTAGETPLVADTDYKVYITDGAADASDQLAVILTESGLQKAQTAKEGNNSANIVLTFKAKVLRAAVVPNQAQVYKNTGTGTGKLVPGDNPPPPPPGTPTVKTNTTTSAWGKVTILKTNGAQGDQAKKLAGAQFQVYQCTVADNKGTIAQDAQPISVNGENTFTTNEQGSVTIDGLHVNDLANGADAEATSYCLVETQAPAGYELRHEPIPFKLLTTGVRTITEKYEYDENGTLTSKSTSEALTELVSEGSTLALTQEVVNLEAKPKLPLTGGAGVAIFGLAGAVIIGGGLYAAKRNKRTVA